jgi:UrcA family protein
MKTILATGLLAGMTAYALATPATAGQSGATQPTAVAVPVADLDLRFPADAARLDRRIQAAVARACPFERIRPQASAACRADALALARGKAERAIAAARNAEPAQLASR